MVAIFTFTKPVSADFFAQEDGLVENMSAVFLIIGSLLTLYSGLVFHRRKQTSTAIAAFMKHEPDTPLFVGTLVISVVLLLYSLSKINSWSRDSAYIILSMIAVTFCAVIVYTLSHATHGTRPWFPSEYRELYIAMGIAFYGLYLTIDTRKKQKTQQSTSYHFTASEQIPPLPSTSKYSPLLERVELSLHLFYF